MGAKGRLDGLCEAVWCPPAQAGLLAGRVGYLFPFRFLPSGRFFALANPNLAVAQVLPALHPKPNEQHFSNCSG